MKNDDLELMDKLKEMPKWISENEDGTYTVTTKSGDYIMEEQSGEVYEKASRLSEKLNIDLDSLLVTRSLVKPKLTDDEFKSLKGSSYLKLKMAITYIYDMQDFL